MKSNIKLAVETKMYKKRGKSEYSPTPKLKLLCVMKLIS